MIQRKVFKGDFSSTDTARTQLRSTNLRNERNVSATSRESNQPQLPSQAQSAKTSSSQLDDLTIIRHFIQGDAALASNYRLYVQTIHEVHQLYTTKGQLIARARHDKHPAKISVRPLGEYAELLKKMLLEHEFMPLGLDRAGHFMEYEYHPIPDGYALNLTSAHELWKYWWHHLKLQAGFQNVPDILAFLDGQWSVVRNLVLQKKTLFITSDSGEAALQDCDDVTWLHPQKSDAEEDKTVCFTNLPSRDELAQVGFILNQAVSTSPKSKVNNNRDSESNTWSPNPPTPLGYVRRCSDNKLIIETPHGQVVVMGDRLNFFVGHNFDSDTPQE